MFRQKESPRQGLRGGLNQTLRSGSVGCAMNQQGNHITPCWKKTTGVAKMIQPSPVCCFFTTVAARGAIVCGPCQRTPLREVEQPKCGQLRPLRPATVPAKAGPWARRATNTHDSRSRSFPERAKFGRDDHPTGMDGPQGRIPSNSDTALLGGLPIGHGMKGEEV